VEGNRVRVSLLMEINSLAYKIFVKKIWRNWM
jgi:hypothetical protein